MKNRDVKNTIYGGKKIEEKKMGKERKREEKEIVEYLLINGSWVLLVKFIQFSML